MLRSIHHIVPQGWKYEHAFESSQKYKEGKFIIELAHMIKEWLKKNTIND